MRVLVFLVGAFVFTPFALFAQCSAPDSLEFADAYALREAPEFPGGEAALLAYIARQPQPQLDADETLVTSFAFYLYFDAEGRVLKVCPLRHSGHTYILFLTRILEQMPPWAPGRDTSGQAVPCRFLLPLRIELR